ncbi:MAG TPA: hypothetical protein VMF11_08850 [Candidatus Baltobacteraceae bacterium]|nr:hypothetical protein [Candidatus Baltobacteraceae bacterium]
MESELSARCHDAREHIVVPAVPLDAIRDAAQRPAAAKGRSLRRSWIAALLGAASLAAIAAGAAAWHETHVTFAHSGAVLVTADRMTAKFRNASTADALAAARSADFPVVLPAGLPPGSRLSSVFRAGPGAIVLGYALPGARRASRHPTFILLANPSSVSESSTSPAGKIRLRMPALGVPAFGSPIRWRVGGEDVIIGNNNFTPSELTHIKHAMLALAR